MASTGLRWALAWVLLLAACDGDASPDAAVGSDAALDASTPPPDAPPRPMPTCEALPAVSPPACGGGPSALGSLLPGPGDPGYDAALDAEARRRDRQFHAIHALHTGVNTEVRVALEADREAVRTFLLETDGWDLEAHAGRAVHDMVEWRKVAGAYGGAGAVADAFRYATLRDSGAACEDVDRAREHVLAAIEAHHRATAITGVEGVIARGFIRTDVPGAASIETVPLFDASGAPLPAEKTNGTWREDNSAEGLYPEYIWEDSCSRDMLIGWVLGMGALWEVASADPTIDAALLERMADDARAIGHSLMQVGEDGYDLEIHDADGRLTFHAYLHENAVDRVYLPGRGVNGQHAAMALGIIAVLARVSGDAELARYLHEELIERRALHEIVRENATLIDAGTRSNFSNYNMSFTGLWLAQRYLCDDLARSAVAEGTTALYGAEGAERQPSSQAQTFYDFVFEAAYGDATVTRPLSAVSEPAYARGLASLTGFPAAPFFEESVINCDEAEIAAMTCTAIDGETTLTLLGEVGRGDELVAAEALPMALRPPSNYHWRSDPYRVNREADGTSLFPGVDFRVAYWMGRHLRRGE